jgi:aspartate ammonia-lyase
MQGQLQLNVFEPVIASSILHQLRLLARGYRMLRERCVVGITANEVTNMTPPPLAVMSTKRRGQQLVGTPK